MRLFATGAVRWVMERTLPEGEAIEAKMVSKAIERAREHRRGTKCRATQGRSQVRRSDERATKGHLRRRQQILDGVDLHERTLELFERKISDLVSTYCPTEFKEEWQLEGLFNALVVYTPTSFTLADLESYDNTDRPVRRPLY
jgi:preprotein translocase subunit SecA